METLQPESVSMIFNSTSLNLQLLCICHSERSEESLKDSSSLSLLRMTVYSADIKN